MNNIYEWHGVNPEGHRVCGKESAADSSTLRLQLQTQGITVFTIKKIFQSKIILARKISAKQLTEFTRQMALLCEANIDLAHALQMIIQEEENLSLRKLVIAIQKNIENGMRFSDALALFPHYFDAIYCGLIHAGEQSGTLGKILAQLSIYQELMLGLRAKIAKSLFYPAAVLTVAALITGGLLIFVVPQFKNIFNSFGAQLPLFTQMVIHLSNGAHIYAAKFLVILTIVGMGYRYWIRRSAWLHARQDHLLLQLPFIGPLLTVAVFTRWARVLATLLSAELSLVDALQIAANTIANRSIKTAMQTVVRQVSGGSAFYQALSAQAGFPRRMIQMIAVGENAGQLAAMLEKIADMQHATLDRAIDYFSKWLEPAVMILLAIITGSLIIAMYLPVFKLGAVL